MVYLVAILDWFSRYVRYVLAWEISRSLEGSFCLQALEQALRLGRPHIFNSDQGSQFTSSEFTGRLEAAGVCISMDGRDGRGRYLDNIFVERPGALWARTVKYEEVYLKEYETAHVARVNLGQYFAFYNSERLYQALDYKTPREVYFGT